MVDRMDWINSPIARLRVLACFLLALVGADDECFDGVPYPRQMCCSTQFGPRGMEKCFNEEFTFDRCCSGPQLTCTSELVMEMRNFLSPSSPKSFRDFWRSDEFYVIERVWRESTECTMAFLASRVLAFTKLPWDLQWEVIHTPPRATRNSNFQLVAIVQVMRLLTTEIPLWTIVTSTPWSTFIFERLYAHCKKLAYWLLSDGRPLLHGKLPLSDVGETSQDEAFRDVLSYRLNRRFEMPASQANAYGAELHPRTGGSLFGLISAHLTIALDLVQNGSYDSERHLTTNVARQSVERAEEKLRLWASRNEYGDLFFTRWPIFRLLYELSRSLDAEHKMHFPAANILSSARERNVLVLTCGNVNFTSPHRFSWAVRTLSSNQDICVVEMRKTVLGDVGKYDWVLFLSPFVWEWTAQHSTSVSDALHVASQVDAALIGLPIVSHSGQWVWPVRSVGIKHQRLEYRAYPTGYPNASGYCAIGQTTSGTRLYRSALVKSLMRNVVATSASAFFVELDVLIRRQQNGSGAAYTCMFPPLHEDDYLDHADLPLLVATSLQVQEAIFSIHRRQFICDSTTVAAADVGEDLSPCTAADVSSVLLTVAKAWTKLTDGTIRLVCAPCPSSPFTTGQFELLGLGRTSLTTIISLKERIMQESAAVRIDKSEENQLRVCGVHAAGCLVFLTVSQSNEYKSERTHDVKRYIWGVEVWTAPPRISASLYHRGSSHSTSHSLSSSYKVDVQLIYCGPLVVSIPSQLGWTIHSLQHSADDCTRFYKRVLHRLPSFSWVVFLSPLLWEWGDAQLTNIQAGLQLAMEHDKVVTGFPTLDQARTWRWPAAKIRHRFWKLQYTDAPLSLTHNNNECEKSDTTSGTRIYRPGALQPLIAANVNLDSSTLLVHLDIELLRRHGGEVETCMLPPMHENCFREQAILSYEFATRHQVEAAQFTVSNSREICLGTNGTDKWAFAHALSDKRLATRLCYRRLLETQFVQLAHWWESLDAANNFVSVKQGTLLTAMIRGGEVSMMPWDNDLEMSFYSIGANPVLSWCTAHVSFQSRINCILKRLSVEIGLPVDIGPDFLSSWLYTENLVFPKLRIQVDGTWDISFEGWVPRPAISVRMFGQVSVHVNWNHWEQMFFEIFSGTLVKKVGTSGNIGYGMPGLETCVDKHNACIPMCTEHTDDMHCIFEFDDYFAHTRDPSGKLFSLP